MLYIGDGYDKADYRNASPAFGSMRDFHCLMREAHECDQRVIMAIQFPMTPRM
jgi:glycosidase